MLDIKRIREHRDEVAEALHRRDPGIDLGPTLEAEERRLAAVREHDELRHRQRVLSEVFRSDASAEEKSAVRGQLKGISDRVKELADAQAAAEVDLEEALLQIPNAPAPEVPVGETEDDNPVVREVGHRPDFPFEPKDHLQLGVALGILDLDAASKISGARFALYLGLGARLERALMAFMLDLAVSRGYSEVLPPHLVTRDSMTGTGQLPKFEEDAFAASDGLFLVPTAEVPVTNMHREEILPPGALPRRYCAYTACFRREAGSYGKVTRGLIRLHQFQKVELVRFSTPEASCDEHLELLDDAEEVLRRLDLPYRVVELCTGDLGFAAQRCFDIEVWSPGMNRYVEISSCSNFGEYQARRARIRFRAEKGARPRFVHTLNGSALAIGRTVVALLENGQQADGSVVLPEALVPYMRGVRLIEKAG